MSVPPDRSTAQRSAEKVVARRSFAVRPTKGARRLQRRVFQTASGTSEHVQGSTSLFGSFACAANSWKGCTGQELSRNALEDRTPKRSDSGTRCRHCQWGAGLWLAARSTSFRSFVLGEPGLTAPAKGNNRRVQKPPIHALYTYPCSQCLRYPSFSNSISEYSFSDHSARSPSV